MQWSEATTTSEPVESGLLEPRYETQARPSENGCPVHTRRRIHHVFSVRAEATLVA